MSPENSRAFWEAKNSAFRTATPDCDLLHREARASEPGPELTETSYIPFSVPDGDIHAFCYLWHHPNLGVVTGGIAAWQGVMRHPLQCELFDILTYVDGSCLANDLYDVQLPNGYRQQLIDPLRTIRISYADDHRDTRVEVELTAIAEPMVLETGMHMEQAMRVRGTIRLRGRQHDVDCSTVRDRSWGQLRREVHVDMPPLAWMTCVFSDEFAFGATVFDSENSDPEWAGVAAIPGGDPVRGGWVLRGRELIPIVSAIKATRRDRATLRAERVQMTLTDARGEQYEIGGRVRASVPWNIWQNLTTTIALAEWECDGHLAAGEFQEALPHDYVHRFLERPSRIEPTA